MISVIIPLYNSIDTIIESIESVLNQSYKGLIEVLVINDGSTDGGDLLVSKFINEYHGPAAIKLINKTNGGVSSARNAGINKSAYNWIALLDSDDIWLPEKLERQIHEIESNQQISFIGTNRNNDIYPFFAMKLKKLYFLNAKKILLKWHPHTSTVLIKKETLISSGLYDETRSHAEDGDLWLRIAEHNNLYVLNEDLVYTGGGKRSFGDSGLSADVSKMYQGEILALKSAKKRKQINFIEYLLFYKWISIKYIRRKIIMRF